MTSKHLDRDIIVIKKSGRNIVITSATSFVDLLSVVRHHHRPDADTATAHVNPSTIPAIIPFLVLLASLELTLIPSSPVLTGPTPPPEGMGIHTPTVAPSVPIGGAHPVAVLLALLLNE